MTYVLAALLVATLALSAWMRLAPVDPARWHVDPLTVADPSGKTSARLPQGVVISPQGDMAARIAAALAREPRLTLLAGSLAEGWASYVQRSALIGYPDILSIRIVPQGEGQETVAMFSRSRYGEYDWGVNAARIARLRAALTGG